MIQFFKDLAALARRFRIEVESRDLYISSKNKVEVRASSEERARVQMEKYLTNQVVLQKECAKQTAIMARIARALEK